MLNYKFFYNEIGTPQFSIKGNLEGLNELGSCDRNYLQEIITSLENVQAGKLIRYDFGHEVYLVESSKEFSRIIDTYDNWKYIAEIPTQQIYEMMRNWQEFLIESNNQSENTQ